MEETIKGKHEMEETNTIKGKEVIAYKGKNSDMTCRDFKYELVKSYKTDKAELCKWGFHACLNPRDVLEYYTQTECPRYFKVKLSGEITKCGKSDTKVAATEITILEEINIDEVIETTEWWKNYNVLLLLYYSDGFARVQRANGEYNFINKNGKFLSNEWFKWSDDFHDGFARVQRANGEYNFIDKNGNYLFDKWFYWLGNFQEGFARVARTNGEWNFIDKDGNYLFNEWFYYLENFNDGLAKVRRSDEKYNFIDIKGKILSKQWFIYAYSFKDGFAKVEREDYLYNLIDRQGDILSNKWFDYVGDFKAGVADVKRTNGEWAKIDKTGKLIKICNRK